MNSKAMSLKAKIKNLAKAKNMNAQVLLQNYMFERFLERLSLSDYRDKFVLKGGMLIAAIVGMDIRSTMDLDATLRGLPLSENSIKEALDKICSHMVQDDVTMILGNIDPIRPDDVYGGYRAKISARYDSIEVPFAIDISTGDVITPKPIKYAFKGIFDEEKQIEIWAYNIETVLAEKIETILRRSTLSTRPRDFYDVYIICLTQSFDKLLLKEALDATAAHRGSTEQIADIKALLEIIGNSSDLKGLWEKYRREYVYAKEITYEQVIEMLRSILNY